MLNYILALEQDQIRLRDVIASYNTTYEQVVFEQQEKRRVRAALRKAAIGNASVVEYTPSSSCGGKSSIEDDYCSDICSGLEMRAAAETPPCDPILPENFNQIQLAARIATNCNTNTEEEEEEKVAPLPPTPIPVVRTNEKTSLYLPSDETDDQWECVICRNGFEDHRVPDGELAEANCCARLPCNHWYHEECIASWILPAKQNHQECPLCRRPINEIKLYLT